MANTCSNLPIFEELLAVIIAVRPLGKVEDCQVIRKTWRLQFRVKAGGSRALVRSALTGKTCFQSVRDRRFAALMSSPP
jgi:hypothetical protein